MTDQPRVAWEAPEQPTGPAPGYEFGGFGARLVAYIVDGFIVGLAVTLIAIVGATIAGLSYVSDNTGGVAVGIGLVAVFALVVSVGYFPWFWSRSGQTPGMRMLGLKVVRDTDGGPITGTQALLRLIGYWVSGVVMYLGYIWIFVDKRRRGWHDLIAGTVVIREV